MVSFIVVNYRGDQWIGLLLQSIEKTMSHKNYEVVVVANSRTNLDYSEYPTVNLIDNSSIKETGSLGHAKGLLLGYKNLDPRTRTVILVDQDVAFIRKGWDKDISKYLQNYPLVGAPMETSYRERFLRPHFLAFSRAFFDKEILFNDGLMPNIPIGDTAYKLSLLTHRNKASYKVLPNSYNWKEHYDSVYPIGESIYNDQENIICHHVGRSAVKQDRFKNWESFLREKETI